MSAEMDEAFDSAGEEQAEGVMFDDASGDEADQVPAAASHDRLLQNINRLDSKRAGRYSPQSEFFRVQTHCVITC